ncbi:MAG: hypothetical protein KC445_11180 [Anaerolineales bacterium]|nr:hypothetical protein [Anaerolineales bacterium]
MKRILMLPLIFLALTLAACSNPVEQMQEAVSQEIAEAVVEQATGAENVEFDAEDGEISFSVEGQDGAQVDVSVEENSDIEAITGMGFTIPLPDGLENGAVQRIDNDGEEMMVNATFEAPDLTTAELYQAMHEALTSQGFTYFDPTNSGKTEPDTEQMQMIVAYQHPDGYQFTMMGDNTGVLFGLVRLESGAVPEVVQDVAVAPIIPTVLDGSMALDKTSYAAGEAIVVTLEINTPLADNAWVGVIPADTPHGLEVDGDNTYISYDWLYNLADGRITLNAPNEPGRYTVRLYNTDDQGVEVATEDFTVTE